MSTSPSDRRPPARRSSGAHLRQWPRRCRTALRLWRSLRWTERLLLASSAVDLVVVDRLLRRHGYAAALAHTDPPHRVRRALAALSTAEIARVVILAARLTIGLQTSCLRRAIVLAWLLRSVGRECELVAGVTRAGTGWGGHAWVEVDGVPIAEDRDVAAHYPIFQDRLSRRYLAK